MFDEARELISKVNDPTKLKEMAEILLEMSEQISKDNKALRKIVDKQELAKQQLLSSEFDKNLHRLKRVAFGFGRELNKLRDRERLKNEKQLTMQSSPLVRELEVPVKKDLPEEVVVHRLSEEDVIGLCLNSGMGISEGDEIECEQIKGLFEESREITITERIYTQIIHKRIKYRAKNTNTGEEKIVTAPGPIKLYPKSQYSVDFAIQAVCDKFLNYLPYERQRREMRRAGLNIPVSTLCRLETGVAFHLNEVAEKIREDILSTKHLAVGLDETRWPILNKKDSNGYFWIICNQAGSYYRFESTRSGEVAKELLEDYTGSVISDKFSGYLQFIKNKKINWGLCLAHARRDFVSLQEYHSKECGKILDVMDKVFKIEHTAKNWQELEKLREEKSAPLMAELKVLLEETKENFFPQDEMTAAINYVLSNWQEFTNFLADVRLPVSNNESERALRQAVLGRKNYRGSKTIDAADRAATLFTVIESCKKAELDPKDYIKYVIEKNEAGEVPLTPMNLAIERRGRSGFWQGTGSELPAGVN